MPRTAQPEANACLHTAGGTRRLAVRVASTFLARLRGLMFSAPLPATAGLLITRCSSVHCAFMRQAIDVVYLDRDGVVTKCVPGLKPWRASFSHIGRDAGGLRYREASHTLELAAGSIDRYGIAQGDRLEHPAIGVVADLVPAPARQASQRGASLVEFVVVGPILTLIGLALVQYGLLFFAKSQMNHASFMAARAGSTSHASLATVRQSYAVALAPLYGGGKSATELAQAQAAAADDVAGHVRIELLNPTRDAFEQFNSSALQTKYKLAADKHVIANSHQAFLAASDVKAGQSIQDANLLKLRITHGYKISVPVVAGIYRAYLKWMDPKTDSFHTRLINEGRVPVVTNVTVEMQSDAIESETVSLPTQGTGGGGEQDPGDTGSGPNQPPNCDMFQNCSNDPTVPGGGGTGNGGGEPGGGYCPQPLQTDMPTDPMFDFGKAVLKPEGQAELDKLIAQAKEKQIKSAEIVGYTDQLGDANLNLKLSQQRAQAVKDYLTSHGFPDVPITVQGKGSEDPIMSLTDCPAGPNQISCLAPNRRVHVTFGR